MSPSSDSAKPENHSLRLEDTNRGHQIFPEMISFPVIAG